MTRHLRIFITLLIAALPSVALAQYEPMTPAAPQPPQGTSQPIPQSVEDPDSDDDSMGAPDTFAPVTTPTAALPKNESKAVPAKPAEVPAAPPGMPEGDAGYEQVVLQGLNKVTARAQPIEAPIGSTVRFGTIEIVAHSCWKSAPDTSPENAALLEISEIKQGEAPRQIFLGWMFSSTPGISALEHPFYDITVVKCEKAVEETKDIKDTKPQPAAANPVKKGNMKQAK